MTHKCINHEDKEAVAIYGSFGSGMYVCRECYNHYGTQQSKQMQNIGYTMIYFVIALIVIAIIVGLIMGDWLYLLRP